MAEQPFLTTGEFTRSMDRLSANITGRFNSVDMKLDDHADRLVLLEKSLGVEKRKTRNSATGWGAAVAGVIVGVVEVVKAVYK